MPEQGSRDATKGHLAATLNSRTLDCCNYDGQNSTLLECISLKFLLCEEGGREHWANV